MRLVRPPTNCIVSSVGPCGWDMELLVLVLLAAVVFPPMASKFSLPRDPHLPHLPFDDHIGPPQGWWMLTTYYVVVVSLNLVQHAQLLTWYCLSYR